MRSNFHSHTFLSVSLDGIAVNEALLLRWGRQGQMLAGFPIGESAELQLNTEPHSEKQCFSTLVSMHWGLQSVLERGYSGSTQCTWTSIDCLESPNVLRYSAGLGARPLLTWIYIFCLPYPHTSRSPAHSFLKSCYQLLSDHKRSKNKINCWCTWREANRLRANRRDQMFVSKHTTLRLSLFLLLCPDSFFILFKQLDGKENWLKPNWCFMVSSSAEKMAV